MAEQFLSRLEKIEASIDSLGEMLTRMITPLRTVTELKSDVRVVKDEIIEELNEEISVSDYGCHRKYLLSGHLQG